MFSAWDFNSWIASAGVVLVIITLLTGFGALVNALMSWMWGEEHEIPVEPRMGEGANQEAGSFCDKTQPLPKPADPPTGEGSSASRPGT